MSKFEEKIHKADFGEIAEVIDPKSKSKLNTKMMYVAGQIVIKIIILFKMILMEFAILQSVDLVMIYCLLIMLMKIKKS